MKASCPVVHSLDRQLHAESYRCVRNQFLLLYITEISSALLCSISIPIYLLEHFYFSWLIILCGSDTQRHESVMSEYIEFLQGQANTHIFWMSLIVKEHRHENASFYSLLVFISIILAEIYVLLGFSSSTEV